ncbi:MAG: PLDc_N domain-containing protein [Cyclobacteriaceae bacterium]|nr:PLDc_N domain-containing protein [Cyclobacteriaceae bacterium]
MGSILYIAVIVIDVIVVLDILRGNKDNEKKLLWILAVIFLPILGPILYYVIGKK